MAALRPAPGGAPAPPPPAVEHRSLALGSLLPRCAAGGKVIIADLGPADGRNVDFFSRFRCTLFILDLLEGGTAGRRRRAPELAATCRRILPRPGSLHLDLILAWDLLNYLEREEIETVFRQLARWCRPGTALFALVSIRSQLPERPLRFSIAGSSTLRYQRLSPGLRPCPGYREPELARLMPGFRVETTYLLRNGFQEYLFSYEPTPPGG